MLFGFLVWVFLLRYFVDKPLLRKIRKENYPVVIKSITLAEVYLQYAHQLMIRTFRIKNMNLIKQIDLVT
ncbi:hypothetical protein B0A69_10430 [Chryseobacterium shigense]|nr:hypothetical protein B0A69_10430 [Chryseobacterium shigense]